MSPFLRSYFLSYSRSYFNLSGQMVEARDYNLTLSSANYSSIDTANYLRTQFGYDSMGRQNRTVSASDNITRLFFDSLGRLSSTWAGTDDSANNVNMVKLAEYEYDNGGVGDSNLTKTTTYPTSIYDKQVDQVWYDWRNRPIAAKSGIQVKSDGTNLEDTSTNRPIVYYTYNNSDQVVQTSIYDGDQFQPIGPSSPAPASTSLQAPNTSQLLARSRTSYDNLGRAYQTLSFGIDPATGAVATTPLTSSVWYDKRGNVIKATQPGGLVAKTTYDSLNNPIVSYITDGGSDNKYNDAGDIVGDIVFSQSEVQYDAVGNPVLTATRQLFHDQTASQSKSLDSTNSRPYFTAAYFDKYGRPTAAIDFGTNGGADITVRPDLVPDRSNTVHRVDYDYGNMSALDALWTQVTDANGIASRQYSDSLGRTTKTVEAYNAVNPTISATSNKTTEFFYDTKGRLSTVQATLPSNKKQQTGYVYGSSFATGSFINDNDALVATQYAATSTNPALDGLASANEQVTQTIDATGNVLTTTDRNKTKHVFEYDVLGRMISDTVAESGFGVDTSIRRMGITYDAQGNAATLTSYSDPKGKQIANQVVRTFNNLGQLTNEYQSHSGQVNLVSTLKVGYTYADPGTGNNGARQTGMVYPNGRTLTYNYAPGTDDSISRLSSISDGTQTLESYQYLGLSTVVVRAHPVSKVDLTYVKQAGDAANADKYSGLDRFNRVIDQRWVKTGTNPGTADRLQYTYDANDNVLIKTNTLDATKNETYTYDNLNQLTGYNRGAGAQAQSYTMDAMGNFQAVGTGSAATSQTRTTNSQNEINSITTGTGTSATTVALTYDSNGNLTKDETGALLTYDAWNRLVKVVKPVLYGTATVTYTYDTLGRRITETTVAPSRVNNTTVMVTTAKDLYYSKDWQVLEEREGGVAKTQYVWSPVYVDAMIERDRDVNGGSDGLEERLWPLQDANYNTTALVDSNGTVTERYVYDPYGKVTVYAANGTTVQTASNVDWRYLHQGGRLDTTTGLYNFRNRDYSPTLMRWTTNDPLGFGGGDTNTYRYEGNGPTGSLDPSGLLVYQDPGNSDGSNRNAINDARVKAAYNKAEYARQKGVTGVNIEQELQAIETDRFWGKYDWAPGKPKQEDELDRQLRLGAFGLNIYGAVDKLSARQALAAAATTIRYELPAHLAQKGVDLALDRVTNPLFQKFASVLLNATKGVFRIVNGKLYKIIVKEGKEVAEEISEKELSAIKKRLDAYIGNVIHRSHTEAELARLANIRKNLKIGGRRNIAYGEGHIEGRDFGEVLGVSGQSTGGAIMPAKRTFTTGTDQFSRAFDSEVFVLENFASRLKPTDTGTLRLVSQRSFCSSCKDVIAQFRQKFPNIELILVD